MRRHNDFALARGERTLDDEAHHVRDILAQLSGFGPLQAYLDDPEVEELWINAPDRIFVARAGVASRVPLALTDTAVRDLVVVAENHHAGAPGARGLHVHRRYLLSG